jgi:hypothetical protein
LVPESSILHHAGCVEHSSDGLLVGVQHHGRITGSAHVSRHQLAASSRRLQSRQLLASSLIGRKLARATNLQGHKQGASTD